MNDGVLGTRTLDRRIEGTMVALIAINLPNINIQIGIS